MSTDLSWAQTYLGVSKRPCPETGSSRKGKGCTSAHADAMPERHQQVRDAPYPPTATTLSHLAGHNTRNPRGAFFFFVPGNSAHPLVTETLQTSWQRESCSESSFSSCVVRLNPCSCGAAQDGTRLVLQTRAIRSLRRRTPEYGKHMVSTCAADTSPPLPHPTLSHPAGPNTMESMRFFVLLARPRTEHIRC